MMIENAQRERNIDIICVLRWISTCQFSLFQFFQVEFVCSIGIYFSHIFIFFKYFPFFFFLFHDLGMCVRYACVQRVDEVYKQFFPWAIASYAYRLCCRFYLLFFLSLIFFLILESGSIRRGRISLYIHCDCVLGFALWWQITFEYFIKKMWNASFLQHFFCQWKYIY